MGLKRLGVVCIKDAFPEKVVCGTTIFSSDFPYMTPLIINDAGVESGASYRTY